MRVRGKAMVLASSTIVGFVLIKLAWDDAMNSYPLNTIFFMVGAMIMLGGILYSLIFNDKTTIDANTRISVDKSKSVQLLNKDKQRLHNEGN